MRTLMISLAIMVASAAIAAAQGKPQPAEPPLTAEQVQKSRQAVETRLETLQKEATEHQLLLDRMADGKREVQAQVDEAAAEYQAKQDRLRRSARAIQQKTATLKSAEDQLRAEQARLVAVLATYPHAPPRAAAPGAANPVEKKLDAILDRLEKMERRLAEVEKAKPKN